MDRNSYDNEGDSALDVPTAAALRYMRDTAATAERHVALGLSTPTVCVSVAGDDEALRTLPAFGRLTAECTHHRAELLLTPMSMMGCVKLGPRAISVAFANERLHG